MCLQPSQLRCFDSYNIYCAMTNIFSFPRFKIALFNFQILSSQLKICAIHLQSTSVLTNTDAKRPMANNQISI